MQLLVNNVLFQAMVQDLDWLPSYIKFFLQKYLQFEEPVFKTFTINDIVWGYQDPVLRLAKKFDKNYFYTDVVGAMAGASSMLMSIIHLFSFVSVVVGR